VLVRGLMLLMAMVGKDMVVLLVGVFCKCWCWLMIGRCYRCSLAKGCI
jgi:hypothetical protein